MLKAFRRMAKCPMYGSLTVMFSHFRITFWSRKLKHTLITAVQIPELIPIDIFNTVIVKHKQRKKL